MSLRFSPGVAQGCFELLTLCKKYQQPAAHLNSAFSHFGSITADKIFTTVQELDWARVNELGILVPSKSGDQILETKSYPELLRQMLLDYIDIQRPSWVQNAQSGRSKVLKFAGAEIGQIFVEANLADGIDAQTVEFWDTLAARARGHKNDRQNEIGRHGERLTLASEELRTGRGCRWISIESNEDGYDVLSVVAADDLRKLTIEVKTTTMGLNGAFFLTSNEWERAQESSNHIFHLWDISKGTPRVAAVDVITMRPHVPIDSGQGTWQNVKVPFRSFEDSFAEATVVAEALTRMNIK